MTLPERNYQELNREMASARATMRLFLRPTPITELDAAVQREMSFPVGRLDWIGGFSRSSRRPKLEAHLTPAARCFGSEKYIGARLPLCEAIAPVNLQSVTHEMSLHVLTRVRSRNYYLLRKSLANIPGVSNATILDNDPTLIAEDRVVEVLDDNSDVLTFRELKTRHSNIARLIERWAPCHDGVAFYLLTHDSTTYIIPTAELLASCYLADGDTLERFLSSAEIGPYVGRFAAFDGFKYVSLYSSDSNMCFPVRAQRNIARAEHEVQQLFPRAIAYCKQNGNLLPILLRPPFSGTVKLGGYALEDKTESERCLLFPLGCRFGPPNKAKGKYFEKSFAPRLSSVGARLDAVNATGGWGYTSFELEACDIRLFPRIAEAVVSAETSGCVLDSTPENAFKHDNFSRLRTWCLRTGRV